MAKVFHILHHIKPKLVLIGGGGHARACIDVIEQENRFKIYGIVDSNALQNGISEVLGYPILGGDELLESLYTQVKIAFIALGQIKTPAHRMRIYQNLKTIGYNLPTIISPLAYIAKGVNLKEGSIIMHHALVNANAKIGTACIINSKALVEHDCVVEDFCHLSTASVINGNCHIGEGSFLGSNMILAHNAAVAPNSVLYNNPLEKFHKSLQTQVLSKLKKSNPVSIDLSSSSKMGENLTGGGVNTPIFYFLHFFTLAFYIFSIFINIFYYRFLILFSIFISFFNLILRSSYGKY